ncbi:hypothetical protein [Streptosporangium sp. OZ121]|uniref:hypothetical protein n=1 Tax=Streptosporangium sp. OZ121 TaxID=3444183 RepID=UPI003F7A54FB
MGTRHFFLSLGTLLLFLSVASVLTDHNGYRGAVPISIAGAGFMIGALAQSVLEVKKRLPGEGNRLQEDCEEETPEP